MTHYSPLAYSPISKIFKAAYAYLPTLILATTCTWSSSAMGLDCVCELNKSDCLECCGNLSKGYRYCDDDTPPGPNGPTVVMSAPAPSFENEKLGGKKQPPTDNDKHPLKKQTKDQDKMLDNSIKVKP